MSDVIQFYNPLKFFFYLHKLHKTGKLNSKELIKYIASNFVYNVIGNSLNIINMTPEQMLYLYLLHYAGVSIKISAIIILFL